MNLLKDPWLPIIRKNGAKEKIAIHQLLDSYKENPVMELEAPRPDFKNALYQLIIGIVQVSAMPEKERKWKALFEEPYSMEDFSERVLKYEECFEIDSEGPAFMQDFDLPEGFKKESLKNLFINLPANEHYMPVNKTFNKSEPKKIGVYWAAIALYTLQTFAPGGGRGHKAGIRGGGPLSVLVMPKGESTLWAKIWTNIVSGEFISTLSGNQDKVDMIDIFPWMKKTEGSAVYPEQCHPFQMYFGMPRRIRFVFGGEAVCDISGEHIERSVIGYKTRHSGNDYKGAWIHPLTPYKPPNEEGDILSIKPKVGGIGYRHWLSLALEKEETIRSKTVSLFDESSRRDIARNIGTQIWACGYAMEKMKSECWYESTMPLYPLNPKDATKVAKFIGGLVKQAQEISSSLRFAVKSAWFGSPKDAKGDMGFLDTAFWQNTESAFYSILDHLVNDLDNDEFKNNLVDKWGLILKKEVENIFDSSALAQQEDGLNMKRVVKARLGLVKGINKMIKNLKVLKEVEE